MIRDIRMILTRLFTVALLMMISMAAGAQVKVIYGKDGEAMKADEKGTIVIPQKEQKEPLEGGTITITQEEPKDGKVRVNFTVAPASGYTYNDGNITLVAFFPLSSTRADNPADDITVHSTLTLTPKDKSQTDTSKPRDYYVDIDEGLGLWVQKASFISGAKGGSYREIETYYYIANSVGYNANTPAKNFYLLPATNSNYAVGQPHLTTAKSGKVLNCCWQIEESGDYYRIIHVSDGKYLTANEKYSGTTNDNVGRLRVHLQTFETPDDNTLFQRIENNNGGYNIRHIYMTDKINKSTTTYLDPAGGNIDNTDLTNARTITVGAMTINVGGGIGYWTDEPAARWNFEVVTKCPKSDVELTDPSGEVSIYNLPSSIIYYTLTGEDPLVPSEGDPVAPTFLYDSNNKPTISETTTIKAIAVKDGLENSDIATTTIIKVETPTLTYDKGTVIIDCATEGATIYYTTDNTAPTAGSTPYTDAITLTEHSTIVKAIAVKDGCIPSDVETIEAVLKCEKPVIAKVGNTFTITCSYPADAEIFYAIGDGELVTPYNGAVSLTDLQFPFTVRAIAKKTNHDDSEIGSKYFGVDLSGGGTSESPYLIRNADDFEVFVDWLNEDSEKRGKYFKIEKNNSNNGLINLSGCSSINSEVVFTGTLDGDMVTLSGLGHPLFNTIGGSATVKNVILDDVSISSGISLTVSGDEKTAIGAIACVAIGTTRIYNCGILATTSSSVGGTADYVGGLVGFLDVCSRVINCFSYANITGGADCGGIVGYNNVASTSSNLETMVMNCMFYGNIEGTNISPIYGGKIITNKYTSETNTGLNNYNYFRYNKPYVSSITAHNCALGAEDRFLNRFEFYRLTLNSTRDLAAYYVSGGAGDKDKMAKWVLDKSIAPYPILKEPGIFYPSVINPDAKNAVAIDADNQHRNEGRKLGTLTVNIQLGSGGEQFKNTSATLKPNMSSIPLNITDKDFDNFNFNYKKIQLPYYNEVGNGNYTGNLVVTGWKIVEINGSSTGTGGYSEPFAQKPEADVVFNGNGEIESTPYNFVDRTSTNKDLYSKSKRVFNQGAYWEVPDGVTSITIEPYWAKAAYLSDPTYDITYSVNGLTENKVSIAGTRPNKLAPNDQTINTTFAAALAELDAADVDATHTVYDYAVVLVGNYHKCFDANSPTGANLKPVTVMSADFDGDCEPDYTFFYQHTERQIVAPIRFDFINIPGVGMMQKATGSTYNPQPGVFHPKHWFEITNTVLIQFNQFEYADNNAGRDVSKEYVPTILQGGVYEQFVSARKLSASYIRYLHVGGNAWFKNFAPGCHTGSAAGTQNTPKAPISVSGGDYENFYLSGIYCPQWTGNTDNAECYIDGGRFKEVAGAGMQIVGQKDGQGGNVTWCINAADIDEFYGGGINDANPVQGNIYTKISNSYVRQFCGGPKFGDMVTDKTITTVATNCHFGDFYGAGYGGTSLYRLGCEDNTLKDAKPETRWNTWAGTGGHYSRTFEESHTSNVTAIKTVKVNGISVDYSYEYTPFSGGANHMGSGSAAFKVSRFFVDFATVSFAKAHKTTSTLNGCYIKKGWLDSKENASKGNVFGGGNRGSVEGDVSTTITNCDIEGDVYGAGNKADAPTVYVRPTTGFVVQPSYDNDANIFNHQQVDYPDSVTYTWSSDASLFTNNNYFVDNGNIHLIYIDKDFSKLGLVEGNATLAINGNTTVTGDVYGGGAEARVTKNTEVIINGGTIGTTSSSGNVFGGGDKGVVGGNTNVTLSGNTNITGNLYGGGNKALVSGSATVNIVEQ